MPLRGSCQACGSGIVEASPGSVAVSGTIPSVAVTTTPSNWADRVKRVSQLSNPRPLTTNSWALARSRAWSGLGSKTCASESGPIRPVTATSSPPIRRTMSSRMLNETTTWIGGAAKTWLHHTSIRQKAASQRLPRRNMLCHIILPPLRVSSLMSAPEPSSLIPVTLLTGFLGSGKTTVLNHVLKQPQMAATAVIVNEFGEVGLDHLLGERSSEDVVLLNSGCLCCTVRGDIVDTLTNLFVDRVKAKVPFFTRAVIETTGLADPAPVLHTLMTDPIVAARYMLDGVVTTVDAVNGAGTLDRQPEAIKQAAIADRLLLTKTDLAEAGARQAIEVRLKTLNPGAVLVPVTRGMVDPAVLFNIGFYDPVA